jgi:hypothetical protein
MSDGARGYPRDLATHVRARWPEDAKALPVRLETLLDIAYHASFLRDEERPVVCRILVLPKSALDATKGPPDGLLPLPFERPQPCDEHTLRRLSPAADVHRAYIGIEENEDDLVVWGIVQSGPRWLHVAQGGRTDEPIVPATLSIRLVRPGHLQISCGTKIIAELRGGRISDVRLDVFKSKWMPMRFRDARLAMVEDHHSSGHGMLEDDAVARLTGHLAQQMLKRIVATMRSAHHGGTIVIVPSSCLAEKHLFARHLFVDAPGRRRFRSLVLSILEILAAQSAACGRSPVELYRESNDPRIAELDEGLFEVGHLIAALAAMDGAVVLTKRFEILGFGAEIAGTLTQVDSVQRAIDLEATEFAVEEIDGVGTRHRSAYRLCAVSPDTIAIVVSQDGGVRWVANLDGAVTYWDHGLGD